ncbi:hypothetical protein IVA80_15270 [Bradyrhizobium sp. 139]|uniref:hypothetical protein n=1 Tax=Bradyrhizobium sp. 139 TaxID=2782616 RepID=UPI001FFC0E30|nr:hypothetical protein [Bradyrhizobium sp. 139]MCK1742184.1 hypothetical protein [Bradyrhizobium sp. 139]
MTVEKALVLAAAELSYRAPQEFAQFVSALTAYADKRKDECIASTPDMLQVAQGHARACVQLREIIADAPRTAQAIHTKQAQKPSVPPRPHAAP